MTLLEINLQKTLNPEQFQTAMIMDGPAVVMAGAGSGKTHTLVSRVAHLIDSGVHPSQILMLTFTNKAADEMKNRVADLLLGKMDGSITACTYHSFCNMLLKVYGKVIGLPTYQVASPPVYRTQIQLVQYDKLLYESIETLQPRIIESIFSKSANMQTSIHDTIMYDDEYIEYCNIISILEALKCDVDAAMRRKSYVTYDDMLLLTDKLLNVQPVAQKIATNYRYVMVDEFQDTNNLQESFLLKFAKYNQNIVVVGDVSQSIYGFRGANVKNIQQFHTKVSNCKEVVLHQNYRSTQEILDAANCIMKNHVKSCKYHNMVSGMNKHGQKPSIVNVFDSEREADYVFEMIQKFHANGIAYSDIAVLSRGSMQSMLVEARLSKYKIPFEKRGGKKFFEHTCIVSVMAYLRLTLIGNDEVSLHQVLMLHRGIGIKGARKIANIVSNNIFTLSEYANKCRRDSLKREQINKLVNLLERLRAETDFHRQFVMCADFYREVCLDAIDKANKAEQTKENEREKLRNDLKLIQQLEEMSLSYKDIRSFLNEVVLKSDGEADTNQNVDKMVVSTVHSAKGLEWKVVFILDCIEGSFPQRISRAEYGTEKDEEELHCFYVATTRAKEYLYFMRPMHRLISNRYKPTELTHYLIRTSDVIDVIRA